LLIIIWLLWFDVWFADSVNCPVDNIKLAVVVANLAVAEQIGELLVHCRYGIEPALPSLGNDTEPISYQVNPNGCPATPRLASKRCIFLFSMLSFVLARRGTIDFASQLSDCYAVVIIPLLKSVLLYCMLLANFSFSLLTGKIRLSRGCRHLAQH
jgi:hypothetical protein